jgi:hypothetical protein
MTRICRFVVAVALLCGALAERATAEPIRIVGGSMLITGRFEVGSIDIVGTRGFTLQSRVDTGEGSVSDCDACAPGTFTFGGVLPEPAFPGGVATFEGVTYDDMGMVDSPTAITMRFEGQTVLPALQALPVAVTGTFSLLEGSLFANSTLSPSSVPIVGGGTAILSLSPAPFREGVPPGWLLDQIQYNFTDQSAVPEPATMFLAGTGLLAAWRSRKRPAG